jgi:hypothetical protein
MTSCAKGQRTGPRAKFKYSFNITQKHTAGLWRWVSNNKSLPGPEIWYTKHEKTVSHNSSWWFCLGSTVLYVSTSAIIKLSFVMKIRCSNEKMCGTTTFSDSHTSVCYKTHKRGLRRCWIFLCWVYGADATRYLPKYSTNWLAVFTARYELVPIKWHQNTATQTHNKFLFPPSSSLSWGWS